ncbi:hypothetical protein [Xenorhabdus innexi]|uniref:Insecticidal crystal protein-like protein n=1 Tax=Xenorhabdus innexi TaxID=290109 RepID=A0A1N6MX52_9GAMM|nr:hypothetical protein [Xenorhabdus innexi]PHM27818.1 insecticidal crystal protein-like protein [Xenorhabdus innexi]SIP73416.1 hypothetical protein XIS1_2080001 [Xenorhabdus innexi]
MSGGNIAQVRTIFNNKTKYSLRLENYHESQGHFNIYPPKDILPYSEVEWKTENNPASLTGTEASCVYVFYDNDTKYELLFEWDVPLIGSNSFGAHYSPKRNGLNLTFDNPSGYFVVWHCEFTEN